MNSIKKYLSLIKFSHSIFALPFACIGYFLAIYKSNVPIHFSMQQQFILFLLITICMITARSAAMAFNRYLDRSFDAKNPRTAIREIPMGVISPKNALLFTTISCVFFVATCATINTMVLLLSPIALLVILIYSYTKRFTALCHIVLGVGLSLAPIGAYLAITAHFASLPILFSLIVLFWVSGFDIVYALQDAEFDKQHNLYSIPAMVGKKNAVYISRFLHFLCAATIVFAGFYGNFGWLFLMGSIGFIAMLFYQQSIVSANDLSKINIAFMTSNGIASIVFAVFVVLDILIFGK
jgi:4-hydroxybenzoate polyprenyltransferase